MAERLRIDRLGHRGDGIAQTPAGPVYVPFTLPGELVEATGSGERAHATAILETSPERAPPICRHFGLCGGCSLQHLAPETYRRFKRDLVVNAFAARGLTPEVLEPFIVPAGSRRRAAFTAERQGGQLRFGYHERLSHRVVDITENPILIPEIVAALPRLKGFAALAAPAKGSLGLLVTATASGLDVALSGLRPPDNRLRLALTEAAVEADFARLSVAGEVLIERRPPQVTFGRAIVTPPPGGFLQAAPAAEARMTDAVLHAARGARRIADLFAGSGTFALRLAEGAQVHAVEGDAPALAALARGARATPGLKPVTTERRDLFRRPLLAGELEGFDAVVFDPPRAGAMAQAAILAASNVPVVIAVSCNPASLARDARIMVDGGYELSPVLPIDQFLYSAQIEAVAVFQRS